MVIIIFSVASLVLGFFLGAWLYTVAAKALTLGHALVAAIHGLTSAVVVLASALQPHKTPPVPGDSLTP